jgi:splicing factor 3B subunit 1
MATYEEVMAERQLEREEERVKRAIEEKEKSGGNEVLDHKPTLKDDASTPVNRDKTPPMEKKRRGEAGTRAAPTKPQSPRLKFKRSQRSRNQGSV